MFEAELAFATEFADRADEVSMSYFLGDFEVTLKPDSSPVTDADLAVEALFRDLVDARFPNDGVIGEEEGSREGSDRVWVIDPIDGTKNFSDDVPMWATLLALQVHGQGVLGIASAPALRERYVALRGGGATWNGRPIHVSQRAGLDQAFFVYSSADEWLDGPHREGFLDLLRSSRRNRGFGDFWGHVLVARGAADVMAEIDLAIWDWAAVKVIVEEAGGRVTTFDGGEPFQNSSVLTTNGLLHDELISRLSG
jgi:histidinol-phosphatase